MNVTNFIFDDVEVIRLQGKFIYSTHAVVRTAIDNAARNPATREIHLDFGDVSFIDSSGLGLLLNLRDTVKSGGKSVALTKLNGHVKQAVEAAHFHKLFTIR